ncbi:MAG: hypothetical protein M1426_06110 [Patescibacteria group bacterium]|nr:hypothetical protein [Patescibacteria group bacterium]
MSRLTQLPQWTTLETHFQEVKNKHLKELFSQDFGRADKFSIQVGDLLLDYSKNRITQETMKLLFDLARACEVEKKRDSMFAGEKINSTMNWPVLHIALRNRSNTPINVDGKNVMEDVNKVLAKMREFSQKVRSGGWKGFTGKPIKNIINIGIGGSDLGPEMSYEALKFYSDRDKVFRFVSNVDGTDIVEATRDLNLEETLFIISSKSFTTPEPITNAKTVRQWVLDKF